MARLLIVYHTQSGRTEELARAALPGAREAAPAVDTRLQRAADTGADDLRNADGYLICTPENFGYMAGQIKDLFDRTFYPLENQTTGRPYAVLVACGNDGRGALREVGRIATGYGWKPVHPGHIARQPTTPADLDACREIGGLLAAGLEMGLF